MGKCTISKGGGAVAIRGSMRERGGELVNLILRGIEGNIKSGNGEK